MKTFTFGFVSLLAPFTAFASALCPSPWHCEKLALEVPYTSIGVGMGPVAPTLLPTIETASVSLRVGYFPEKGETFRGNILYFEGLGDSMVNHAPLFTELSNAGFRVIAFDYMGQGGSNGKMNHTRISVIPKIGEKVWKKFARDLSQFPKKTIIGWSTGGLAAYLAATEGKADQVILLAPGIAPNTVVGGGLLNFPINEITPESLTTAAPYAAGAVNPHLDPIRPNSPVKVPAFAIDLITTAKAMRKKKVSPSIRGLVLLSGSEDTYVDAKLTKKVLLERGMAPHFSVIPLEHALHEIDNERPEIQAEAFRHILDFLK